MFEFISKYIHGIAIPGLDPKMYMHTSYMIYIVVALLIFSLILKGKLNLVPGKVQSIVELILDTFVFLAKDIIGQKAMVFVPFVLTFFIFILLSNAIGMIPGFFPPTANLNTTAALAIIVFVVTHIVGVKAHGISYLKHFMGPSIWLAPLMIPIEVIGHFARPVSLSLRLFGNIMGHEKITMVLLLLVPIAYPLLAFSTVLGVLVVVIQAFVFALLTMAYIGGSIEEAH